MAHKNCSNWRAPNFGRGGAVVRSWGANRGLLDWSEKVGVSRGRRMRLPDVTSATSIPPLHPSFHSFPPTKIILPLKTTVDIQKGLYFPKDKSNARQIGTFGQSWSTVRGGGETWGGGSGWTDGFDSETLVGEKYWEDKGHVPGAQPLAPYWTLPISKS